MKKVEIYWTEEYLDYAEREVALIKEENDGGKHCVSEPSGTSREE